MKQHLLVVALLVVNPLSAQADTTESPSQPTPGTLIMEDFNTNSIIYTNSEGKVVIENKREFKGPNDQTVKLLLDSSDLTISQK